MPDVTFERPPVVVCQCIPPCHLPIVDAEGHLVEKAGCLRPQGHEGGHSLDGPGDFTYRETPERVGPRVVLAQDHPGDRLYRGTCWRCGREYAIGVVTLGAEAVAAIVEEDGR